MLTRETRTRLEGWLTASAMVGMVPAAALAALGAPAWAVMLPLMPGMLWALGAFACLTLVADRGPFAGSIAGLSILLGLLASWELGAALAIGAMALRAIAEAMDRTMRCLGWHGLIG